MAAMRCDDCRALLDGYIDGELMDDEARQVRDHLDSCGACAAELHMLTEVSSRMRGLDRPTAPDLLKARIREAIAQPDVAMPIPSRPHRSTWRLVAAGLLIGLAGAGGGAYLASHGSVAPRVQDEVLSSHLRSLMPGHLTDVASTDQHNVKPWFNGRAAFSPAVPRLDSAGFPLVGGRLDYVGHRQAAAVVYARRQHRINVFSWPEPTQPPSPPALSTERGYHLLRWSEGGVEYWATSDLNVGELRAFVDLFRQEAAK
jgi:anti-sigma factor RsiW